MPKPALLSILLLFVPTTVAAAQESKPPAPPAPIGLRKQAHATRVAPRAIRVDGRLDEEIWLTATAIDDFTQKEPVEGEAPTDAMEVRFVYDDAALYIGARMYTRTARQIQMPLGRRDNSGQAEHILVSLDTFLDRRTAVVFGVTASGVRIDRFRRTTRRASTPVSIPCGKRGRRAMPTAGRPSSGSRSRSSASIRRPSRCGA